MTEELRWRVEVTFSPLRIIAFTCISVTIRNQTYACGTGTRQLGGLGLGRSVAENGCVQMRVGHLTKGLFNLFARLLRRLRHTAAQLLSAHASHCIIHFQSPLALQQLLL